MRLYHTERTASGERKKTILPFMGNCMHPNMARRQKKCGEYTREKTCEVFGR